MIIMSGLGVIANVYYDGIIGFIMPVGLKIAMKPNFWLLLYQNAIGIIALALLFLAAAFLFKQKGIRAIDFLGTVALARYPLLISITLILLERLYQGSPVDDVSGTIELHFSIVGTISNLIFMACMIWQIMTYFFALREASGLEGKRLWYGFIIAILLGEVIGIILTRLFLYI